MKVVEEALYTRLTAILSGDPPAGGVHTHPAAQGTVCPMVTFQKQAAPAPARVMGGGPVAWDTLVYYVRAIVQGDDKTPGETLHDTIRAGLDNYALPVSGRSLMALLYVGGLDYAESVGGETYHHVGGLYQVQIA